MAESYLSTSRRSGVRLHPLEFAVFRLLRGRALGHKWLVAVSGGADSVALLHILLRLASRLRVELAIAHVHHGPADEVALAEARDRAHDFVGRLARRHGLAYFPFFPNSAAPTTGGEDGLRRLRHGALEQIRAKEGFDYVVYAHHHDDLLETRLLRLIRGTGTQGLGAMRLRSGKRLRPLLGTRRSQLVAYLREKQIAWHEDPSNASSLPLRNWVRLQWLPALEQKRPGAAEALARSLGILAETLTGASASAGLIQLCDACLSQDHVDRRLFDPLRRREKRFLLALYLKRLGARGFGRGQIEEVIKRLHTQQNRLVFRVGGYRWVANAEQIRAEPLAEIPFAPGTHGPSGG